MRVLRLCSEIIKRHPIRLCLLTCASSSVDAITVEWQNISGYSSKPPYGWNFSYDIGYYDNSLMIDIDVRLTGDNPGDTLRERWEYGIESIWSTDRFEVPILFNIDWVDIGYDYSVTVRNGTGRWNMLNWYTVGASGWGDSYQEEAAAHEYGHMFSLWDEYKGGAVNPLTGLINTGGIMHILNGPPLEENYYSFLDWYRTNVTVDSSSNTFTLLGIALAALVVARRNFPRRAQNHRHASGHGTQRE